MSGSKIGKNCKITNTVVGEGVDIGTECILQNVILGDGVIVEAGSNLKDCRIPNPN
jgi:ADP-glucose pyrophosphorylase